jgi:2-oxoglutarate dehydrogenase E2 component (dihydrolipoamide succinyltransferase)
MTKDELIVKLAMAKLAADENSKFNEDTPESKDEKKSEETKMKEQAPAEAPAPAPAPAQEAPVEEAPAPAPSSPGVAATQEFLAPIMDQAMQGDQNAKDIVARTAGEMAAAVDRNAQGGAPAEMAPPPTPEEQAANGIIPPEASAPGMGGGATVVPGAGPAAAAAAVPGGAVPAAVAPGAGAPAMAKTSSYVTPTDVINAINLFR